VKVGELRFPSRVLPETKASFETDLPNAEKKFVEALRHVIASAPRISPADDKILSESAGYNAAIRTTCVTTMLQASPQDNVLPTTAEATINCRILPGDTRAQVQDALTKAVAGIQVELVVGPSYGDSAASPYDGEVIEAVKKIAATAFPGAVVQPGMSSGATDSRFLRGIGIRSYGVSPGTYSLAEAKAGHLAHGPDERRPLKWIVPGALYFRDVVRTLAL
jgi:acetylornithine deacetylase/succinyl-diaminopimelate desuccinylase-like protein